MTGAQWVGAALILAVFALITAAMFRTDAPDDSMECALALADAILGEAT